MAGSPLKRQRKAGIRTEDGTVIRFPYMPRVADLRPGWRYFTTAEKIGHLIGLDRCREILSWGPITELDPLRLSFQMQVIRIMIGFKAVLDGTLAREAARDHDRQRLIEELARRDSGAGEGHRKLVRGKPGQAAGVAKKSPKPVDGLTVIQGRVSEALRGKRV